MGFKALLTFLTISVIRLKEERLTISLSTIALLVSIALAVTLVVSADIWKKKFKSYLKANSEEEEVDNSPEITTVT